jgi:1-acyl-sn-glycerol-3-phosphate acyltransferase
MKNMNWHYEPAKDSGLSFVDRLKECPREPDLLVYGLRVTAAVAIRTAMRAYFRFDIVGREHLPRDASFVLVANHASHLDAIALLSALPLRSLHRAYPVAARDYFESNKLRLALTTIIANVMLFDRDAKSVDGPNGKDRLKLCDHLLDEQRNVLIMFPEGTRSPDGGVGIFRRGIGSLLAGTTHPVVPCYLEGTFRAWPKGTFIPRPARVRLVIGEARTYEQVEQTDAGILSICAELRKQVLALAPETRLQEARPISKEVYS